MQNTIKAYINLALVLLCLFTKYCLIKNLLQSHNTGP
jgi:hypothetical protein